ncbi:HAD family hydrolase [Tengunoibacter tsumagoiensis]|uniref:Pyrophosphatase PpaX n=1 Tax=Tengunoibacter tsumagoiensis TaxID=2014871 RepID=A0A402A788_9CHLR|nr:HAD family hydrolase [Tengunoibacter tsumagoiensis]GCE14968.1 pyrophosphatase PpaX [Tengunoibacter tsumagoiensis]
MKAILFDLDGTLINSEWLAKESYNYGVRQVVQRDLSPLEIQHIAGKPISVFLTNFPGQETEILTTIFYYYEQHLEKIRPYDQIHDMLQELSSAGLKMGIVTSQLRIFAEKVLANTDLKSYFQTIISAEDCQEHKPHPLPLLHAAQHLDIHVNDCVYIGDQLTDIEAAHAAGMKSGAALWGEGNREILVQLSPTFVFTDPKTLFQELNLSYR